MTTDAGSDEGAEEAIEDLEAPAAAQGDVVGGADTCGQPSFMCFTPTCGRTEAQCSQMSHQIVVQER